MNGNSNLCALKVCEPSRETVELRRALYRARLDAKCAREKLAKQRAHNLRVYRRFFDPELTEAEARAWRRNVLEVAAWTVVAFSLWTVGMVWIIL